MPGLFGQYGVNPTDLMQRRPIGRPVGMPTGGGMQRAGVSNPALQGMQFTQSPVARTMPIGGMTPMPRPPMPAPQPMGLQNQYANNVLNKYGMRGY